MSSLRRMRRTCTEFWGVLDKQSMVFQSTKASVIVKEVPSAGHLVGQGQRHPCLGNWQPYATEKDPKPSVHSGPSWDFATIIRDGTNVRESLRASPQDDTGGQLQGHRESKKKLAWTTEAGEALDKLKEQLLGQLGLFLVDPDKGFVLRTNASDYAVRAVLQPIPCDGTHVPVAFWSPVLAESQHRTWTAREKETYTVVCAIRK